MRLPLAVFLFLPALNVAATTGASVEPTWLYGAWKMTHDEDGTPSDYAVFTATGATYVNSSCKEIAENRYHLHSGDVYITWEWPKGPVSQVFRPSPDKKTMKFTSPRTNGTATYTKLAGNPCE